jgi:hypothetical protein
VQLVLITIVFMGIIMLAMAVGVIAGREPLKGSCGGPGAADCLCEAQGVPPKCQELKDAVARMKAKAEHPE